MTTMRACEHGRDGERGATIAIVAILLGTGALLGMLALSFDTGLVYLERRTVQVGADSAAEALAQKCAYDDVQCATAPDAASFVQGIVNANAEDSLTGVEELCGVAPLPACAPLSDRQMDCSIPALSGGRATPANLALARLTTRTQSAAGTFITPVFAGLLDGDNSDTPGITLWSCAQAAWGKVGAADVRIPLLLPACGYEIDRTPVVIPAFPPNPRPAARPVPIEQSCTVDIYGTDGQRAPQLFTDVANGFAPYAPDDAACTSDQRVSADPVEQFTLRLGDIRTLCGGATTSFRDYLNGVLAQDALTPGGLYITYAVAGTLVQQPPPNDSDVTFDVLTFASFRLLGYSLKAPPGPGGNVDYVGGATPPGGWSAYPAGAPNLESCAARSCLYGQFGTKVIPRDRISVSAQIPNMGVQAIEILP